MLNRVLTVVLLFLPGLVLAQGSEPVLSAKPNIVFIFADDLG